jgi:beta-1,4-mannosyl-glycoprotein beta-1,4-N-acetylglucosaminyltransferase
MLIDCVILNDELSLLKYRLELLKDVVDHTVVVESTKTFSGKDKSLFFQKNKSLFEGFNITHIVVDLPNDCDAWHRERLQRNAIDIGVNKLNPYPHDYIIVSDLDELPDPDTVSKLKNGGFNGILTLEQDLYYYHWECRAKGKWHKAKICDAYTYKDIGGPENVRHYAAPHIIEGGWHCSYFGDNEFIRNKIESYSHQELNVDRFKNDEWINHCKTNCKDLFNRGDGWVHVPLHKNEYLPPKYWTLK